MNSFTTYLPLDSEEFNPWLTERFVDYDFNRPHESPSYLAPVDYVEKELAKIRNPVLPMRASQDRS
jgi:hypothetical protein